jgi:hypothetical protein
MKLPNFLEFAPLNDLRRQMGARELGSFTSGYKPNRLTAEELDRLSRVGIDISFDEVTILPDGTLSYKDSRVLVYIRDIQLYRAGQEVLPRFHIADCKTLQDMRAKNRYGRYVVATRDDGRFELNITDPGTQRFTPTTRQLNVCQNCLAKLSFEGFDFGLRRARRKEIVSGFEIRRFFEMYPRSLIPRQPLYTAATAPLNEYSVDFADISAQLRRQRGWRCTDCKCDFSEESLRKFLHVHHKNGMRSDNRPENLSVLCIACHARQPNHEHMTALPEFKEFQNLQCPTMANIDPSSAPVCQY